MLQMKMRGDLLGTYSGSHGGKIIIQGKLLMPPKSNKTVIYFWKSNLSPKLYKETLEFKYKIIVLEMSEITNFMLIYAKLFSYFLKLCM